MKLFRRKQTTPAALYFLLDDGAVRLDPSSVKVGDVFTHVVGYSALGHVFVANAETAEFGVYYPFQEAFKNYGPFESVAAFQDAILEDPGFRDAVLQPGLQTEIVGRLGQLAPGEVFYPVPYPFMGGSGAADTYDKGDFWTFLAVVSHLQGQ